MADYDSDSSISDAGEDISTSVTLGYASKEPTDDAFSQLGGRPSFFDGTFPSPAVIRCNCCDSNMSLLLQLHGDIKSRFPAHERRLYLWSCRQKQCRRKDGSIRAIRSVKTTKRDGPASPAKDTRPQPEQPQKPKQDIGSQLFGGAPSSFSTNPFSSSSPDQSAIDRSSNPFSSAPASTNTLAALSPQKPTASQGSEDHLAATFAQKARISSTNGHAPADTTPKEPWPDESKFPQPYPAFYLDADTEYLSPSAAPASEGPSASHAAFMDVDGEGAASSSAQSSKDDAEAEMTHDKTFQHFADRVSQNDEQILRYEFDGEPLLYSRNDAVGRLFASSHAGTSLKVTTTKHAKGIPRCQNCGGSRVFELQLMPHAIAELESGEEAASLLSNGMDWGTILLGVCLKDCSTMADEKAVSYTEEWVGVQWEEVVKRKG